MCGRFTLRTPGNRLVERFLFELPGELLPPRFNIAPTQPIAAVRPNVGRDRRQLTYLRWGLIPAWSKDRTVGNKLINARCETVAEKPSFRNALKHRRCLILADGYYEWQTVGSAKRKVPCYIRRRDDHPFAFAGLWEAWASPEGSAWETCVIITTEANALTRPIHPRMPVILPPDHYEPWLTMAGEETPILQSFLRPFPSEQMVWHRVSPWVNNPRNDGPKCIESVDDDSGDVPPEPDQKRLF